MKGLLIFGLLLLGAQFGLSLPNEHQRIVNGSYAVAKQFPYQVLYKIFTQNGGGPICGGTLISKRVILTAAHCVRVRNMKAMKVYLGAVDESDSTEIGQRRMYFKFPNIVKHERFISKADKNRKLTKSFNDIALIKLPRTVAFDQYIKPAKLPQEGVSYNTTEATASGWGAVEVLANGEEIYESKLKYFNTSILSNAECTERLKGKVKLIPNAQLCLVQREGAVCSGDSGGPVTVRHKGDSVVLGISSFSECKLNYLSVYTRVASYLKWIRANAGPLN